MRGGRTILTSVASTALVVAASTGIVWPLRCSAAVLVATLVAAGQRWDLAVVTASGLLGLVVVVGAGPASGASPVGLLAWAVPTWAVVLIAVTGAGASGPAPKDLRVRLRLVAGQVAAGCASLPLVVVAAGGGRAAAGWSAAGGLALCCLVLAATSRRAKASRPQAPGPA